MPRSMRSAGTAAAACLMVLAAAGCGSTWPARPDPTTSPAVFSRPRVDRSQLSVGDGRITDMPTTGAIWSCAPPRAGAPAGEAPGWIDGATFDVRAKPVVDGGVSWRGEFVAGVIGDRRAIETNGLPEHTTGRFPVDRADDAYAHDRDTVGIVERNLTLSVPATPRLAAAASCLPDGPIGVLSSGVLLYAALDPLGRDAVAHHVLDRCEGHPDADGVYHYHTVPTCLESALGREHSPLLGYALDGFGIYGRRGEAGVELTNQDLDECHGHTHALEWDGAVVEMYHYHGTWEYPYTIGCFRGTPSG